jgi:hypothetical protein
MLQMKECSAILFSLEFRYCIIWPCFALVLHSWYSGESEPHVQWSIWILANFLSEDGRIIWP